MKSLAFPEKFLWGSAMSAHQVEGNCHRNHWWEWEQEGLRVRPGGYVRDGSVSGVACDYYHRYDDDHRLAADLGHRALRISIEWSRIEPKLGVFDAAAIDHYKRVCDSMLRHGLQPTVTLHHFTNPVWAQRLGGWENREMPDWLARYAAFAARELGDRVRLWWTINEPTVAPTLGYILGIHPPCVRDMSRALTVGRNVLVAHGKMYRAMHEAAPQPIEVGPVLQMPYFEPLDPESAADGATALASDRLVNESVLTGLRQGILAPPYGEDEEAPGLGGSFDVVGVNYYMRILARGGADIDLDLIGQRRASEPERLVDEMGWEVYPEGLYRNLVRVAKLGKPVIVTENGMATLDEAARRQHLVEHLESVWRAIRDGADVRGYFYWSLMDNFEWADGFSRHFGLVEVDRSTLERRPRSTAFAYRDVIRANAIVV